MSGFRSASELEAAVALCATEPIHVPGRIQPHGALLELTEPALAIARASTSCAALLGRTAVELIGKPIESLAGPQQLANLKGRPAAELLLKRNPLKLELETPAGVRAFDGIVHRSGGSLLLELEPRAAADGASFDSLSQQIHGSIIELGGSHSLDDLCRIAASQIRQLSGFDRVMIYQFDADWNGKVIAEDRADAMASFLGLQFPAGDIPQQARELYTRNWLRLIPDAGYQPSDLVPAGAPLDLTYSVLRSVSPVHLEYLRNLGVRASMSVSLIRDGRLWGLIACHHPSARYLPFDLRLGCELIGRFVSLQLGPGTEQQERRFRQRDGELQPLFHARMQEQPSGDFLDGLINGAPDIRELTGAAGVAIVYHGVCKLLGATPGEPAVRELIRWLGREARSGNFATDRLAKQYPAAASFRETGCGLIALRIPEPGNHYVLWFRPEVIQTVRWAGDPAKVVTPSPAAEGRLSPRKSFEQWAETVELRSLPWTAAELEAAAELRRSLIDVDLQRQLIREREARAEVERSNQELDQFAHLVSHDLKEPLRGIRHFVDFVIEDESDKIGQASRQSLEEIRALATRTQKLLSTLYQHSKIGRVELSYGDTDLNDVVKGVLEMQKAQISLRHAAVRVPRALPTVHCDFVRIGEVFGNLLSNALKYTRAKEPSVEIGFTGSVEPVFYVKDDGIGIPPGSHGVVFEMFKRLHGEDEYGGGSGSGLPIARRIIERHGGRIWVESEPGKGSTFFFTLTPGAAAHA